MINDPEPRVIDSLSISFTLDVHRIWRAQVIIEGDIVLDLKGSHEELADVVSAMMPHRLAKISERNAATDD